MYSLYKSGVFKDLVVDPNLDLGFYRFVEETKTKGPKFSNYTTETIENYVRRIYELRENNSNNTAG
jgi:hypothetical protein